MFPVGCLGWDGSSLCDSFSPLSTDFPEEAAAWEGSGRSDFCRAQPCRFWIEAHGEGTRSA